MRHGTRRRAKSGNKTRSKTRNKNKTRGRGRNMRGGANQSVTRSGIPYGIRAADATRRSAAAATTGVMESTVGKRAVRENEGGGGGKSLKVEEKINTMIAAAELSNTESEGELNSTFQGVVLAPGVNPLLSLRRVLSGPFKKMSAAVLSRTFSEPLMRSLSYLHHRSLQRTESAGERRRLADFAPVYEESFHSPSASQESQNNGSNPEPLTSYHSLRQSPLRFVLYTSDVEIATRFSGTDSIQLYHNSDQNVPLTVV
jgi:hypothetical protein